MASASIRRLPFPDEIVLPLSQHAGQPAVPIVREGDRVAAGQKIAEKGSSATNRVKLHFEIRRDGKPVDPLKLLPKRD